jgi:outer membrane beta-barrel protein
MKAGKQMYKNTRKGIGNLTRYTLALTFALVTICSSIKTVSAQEILLEGPLAGAPAVKKKIQYRKLRFSVGPQFGYTLLTDYMHNFMIGGKAEFNVTDWLGIGVVGFYTLNAPTHLTKHIRESQNLANAATVPSDSNWPSYTGSKNFEDQVAKLKSMILAQVAVVPLRGKMAAFEKLFVAIDGYFFLGGGVVIFQERAHCSGSGCGDIRDFQSGGGNVEKTTFYKPTVTFGLGFTAYFNEWIGLNIEYRLAPYKWNASGTDESGKPGKQWAVTEDSDGNIIWDTISPSGDGEYPDGNIDEKDQKLTANQSLMIGVMFNLPKKARITE